VVVSFTAILLIASLGAKAPTADGSRGAIASALAACAAFTPDGSSVAATIKATNLLLEITDPGGMLSQLSLALRYPTSEPELELEDRSTLSRIYSCDTYVDHAGDLVAIGIHGPKSRLQIAVADLKSLKWVGDWDAKDGTGFSSPSLLGFLEETASLVIAGEPPSKGQETHPGSFATGLFDPGAKQIGPTRMQHQVDDGEAYVRYADATNNRLWTFHCVAAPGSPSAQPVCPITSTSLIGNDTPLNEAKLSIQGNKKTGQWFLPDLFAAPDSKTFLIGQGDALWRVDIQGQIVGHLSLPRRARFPALTEKSGETCLSPDGQVIAIAIPRYRSSFLSRVNKYDYEGTDIAVVQLNPLQLLGMLPHDYSAGTPAFAIDHRDGRTVVLVYHQDHWERHELTGSLSR
jgi:hypothetical protein